MIGAKIAALFLVIAGIGLAVHLIRRSNAGSLGRRPELRSRWTRWICGAAGGAILLAFGIVTIRKAHSAAAEVSGPRTLRVPTLPPPEEVRDGDHPKPFGRYLLHLAVVRSGQSSGSAMTSQTFDFHWPSDRHRRFVLHASIGKAVVDAELIVNDWQRSGLKRWEYEGSRSLSVTSAYASQSSSGSFTLPDIEYFGALVGGKVFLSLRGELGEMFELLSDLTPVREDDPLQSGNLEDLIALRGPEVWGNLRAAERNNGPLAELEFRRLHSSPAEALAKALDFNVLPLLAAAILLAQLFRRRWPGFVQVSAAIILYLGALDRFALRLTEAHVRDSTLPVEVRVDVCRRLTETPFFRETAMQHLGELARDASLPPALRQRAAHLGGEK